MAGFGAFFSMQIRVNFMLMEKNLHSISNGILLIVLSFGITAEKITWANSGWIPFTRDLAVKRNFISISSVTAVE